MKRTLCLLPIVMVCFAAGPSQPAASGMAVAPPEHVGEGRVPTSAEFALLVQHNPLAALDASLARFKRDVHGYECIFQKQECLKGKLGPVEVIRTAVREEPFATSMIWEQGIGSAKATLYVAGENGGKMKVKTTFLIVNTDPNGFLARGSARYCIEDAGIFNGTRRTYLAWKAAKDRGELHVEYLGVQKIPELGNRECYVLKRTCESPEVDSFRLADHEHRDAAKYPLEAFTEVTIYLDCETWQQTGSKVTKADGSLMGAYYFRDLKLNPTFHADQFTPAILSK